MLSGIQPTGELMIGNYVGALKNWVELQPAHESFFFLADLHAITVPQDPVDFHRRSLEFVALFLACGVDAERSTIFLQSQVPAHTQLQWLLNCFTPMGQLQRMTQFKDKAGRSEAGITVGLFDYPVLMAADILLYDAELVPVGEDQQQHLEFTRRLARKFNGRFGEVFRIPESCTPRTGARLMGLQAPTAKMSKSDPNPDNYIALLDPPEAVRRKIKTAVTDSGSEIRCDAAKPGISNLISLYAAVGGESVESIQDRYAGKGYAEFKKNLAEMIIEFLSPIQKRYRAYAADPGLLAAVLNRGARNARERSGRVLSRVYRAVGFVPGAWDDRRGRRGGAWSIEGQNTGFSVSAPRRTMGHGGKILGTEAPDDGRTASAATADAVAECFMDCCVSCCCGTKAECGTDARRRPLMADAK
jgi:tryptophanyl-tRNA synthetase